MKTAAALVILVLAFALPTLAYVEVDTSSATATAWSELSGWPPSNALDGDFGTAWSNNRTTNPTTDGAGDWFQVDWPSDIDVCYIRTEGRSYQSGYYSIPKDVRLHFSDASTLNFSFSDTTQDHWVQEYYFDADQKTTDFVKVEFLSYFHHVWEYVQYYEVDFYYEDSPDADPPYVADMEPTDGESDVPIDSVIVFHCKDDLSGVDTTTIDFSAEDTTLGASLAIGAGSAARVGASPAGVIAGDLDVDDADLNDVVCTFTPDDPLPYEDTITCTVDGTLADLEANEMGDDFVWGFTTEENPIGVAHTTWGVIKAEF